MKMELPQEVEIWYVIPVLRKMLVSELKKQGLKQNAIATKLGLTEAAISQYATDKRANSHLTAFESAELKSEISKSAIKIASSSDSNVSNKEINRICAFMREKKILCEIHKKKNPNIKCCDVCY